jgi:signal peptidase I
VSREIVRRLSLVVAAVLVLTVVCLAGGALSSIPVRGTSMEPTIHDGDRIFINPLGSEPQVERFSVVVGRFSKNGPEVVKRVIGLPGDLVRIDKIGVRVGVVSVQPGGTGPWQIVDNPAWNDRWGKASSNCCTADGKLTNVVTPRRVPEGQLFLLGDNFAASDDSRAHGWAPIDLVRAVATWRSYPPTRLGRVTDDVTLRPA